MVTDDKTLLNILSSAGAYCVEAKVAKVFAPAEAATCDG